MKKGFILLVLLLIVGIAYWIGRQTSPRNAELVSSSPTGVSQIPATIESFFLSSERKAEPCQKEYFDLHFKEDSAKVNNDSNALMLLEKGCYQAFDVLFADFTSNTTKDIVLYVAPAECVSCHTREVYVLQGDEIIFYTSGDNLSVSVDKIKNGLPALVIMSAIFGPDEPSGCHEWYLESTYYWDAGKREFRTAYEKPIRKNECKSQEVNLN